MKQGFRLLCLLLFALVTNISFVQAQSPAARIGDTDYVTLQDAVAAVPEDGTETTITILRTVAVMTSDNQGIRIPANMNVKIDLNGNEVWYNVWERVASQAFINDGTLTITDSSQGQTGKITHLLLSYVEGNHIILNRGTLTIEAGEIIGQGDISGNYSGAAIVSTNALGKSTLNIKGGKIENIPENQDIAGGHAVELVAESNNEIYFNMTGGEIVATGFSCFCFESIADAMPTEGEINISGGSMTGSNYAIQTICNGSNSKVSYNFSGGTFNGEVAGDDNPITISGGTFNGHVRNILNWKAPMSVSGGKFAKDVFTSNSFGYVPTKRFITGGLFKSKTYEPSYGGTTNCDWCNPDASLAVDYEVVANTDPVTRAEGYDWEVVSKYYCAIGDTKYMTLEAAVADVPTDGTETTITVLRDLIVQEGNAGVTIPSGKNVVLDLNGRKVSQTIDTEAASQVILNEGILTITDNSQDKDGTLTHSFASGVGAYKGNHVIVNKGSLTINAGNIRGTGGCDFGTTGATVVSTNVLGNSTLNVNGGLIHNQRDYAVGLIAENDNEIDFNMTAGEIYSSGISGVIFESKEGATPAEGSCINISGGSLRGNENAIQTVQNGFNTKVSYNISGGTFNGDVQGYDNPMTISSGTFNGHVRNLLNWDAPMSVTGGKFAKDVFTTKEGNYSVTKNFITGGVFKTKTYVPSYGGTSNCDWCNDNESLANGYIVIENTDPETLAEGYLWTVVNNLEYHTVDLYHGEPYPYPNGMECMAVRYHRDFTSDEVATYPKNYRSWYVPFDYTVSEADLEKFKFYKIHMIAASGNEQGGEVQDVTKVYIYITIVPAGTKLAGNRPYVIVPKEEMEDHVFRAEGITEVLPENNNSSLHVESAEFNYDFYGTYREYGAQGPHEWYALNKQGQIQANKSNAAKLQSYVWALKVTARDENSDYGNIYFAFADGDDTDQISTYTITEDNVIEGFYTIGGVKVDEPVKGVNIIRTMDGKTKKIFVK